MLLHMHLLQALWFISFPWDHSTNWRGSRLLAWVSPLLSPSLLHFAGLRLPLERDELWMLLSGSELAPPDSGSPPLIGLGTILFHRRGAFPPSSSLQPKNDACWLIGTLNSCEGDVGSRTVICSLQEIQNVGHLNGEFIGLLGGVGLNALHLQRV